MLGSGNLGSRPLGYFQSWSLDFPFGIGLGNVTSTARIQLPVNCVLAGQQDYEIGMEWDVRKANPVESTALSATTMRRMSGEIPSFTVRTSHKGYD